jgi:hypothetical protein
MPNTAQSLINSAIGLGYDALSDRDLRECLLYAAQTGGGSGGGGMNYGNGAPNVNTPSSPPFYLDKLTNDFWVWNGTSWVQLLAF